MTIVDIPPAMAFLVGALITPFCRGIFRTALMLGLPLVVLGWIWWLPADFSLSWNYLEYTLQPIKITPTGRLFATVFAVMAFAGNLYALKQATTTELVAALIYAGSAIGVTLCGDLISLFIYWEIMAIGSTLILWSAHTPQAYRASWRYVMLHLLGGVVLMAGIAGHIVNTGSITFGLMSTDTVAEWLILGGFLMNVAAPPVSAWVPDAYPEASPSGAVYLSAFTTKTAVYVLLVAYTGTPLLIYLGLYMIFYGIIYALLENDMRRILAYSIVNQVGFMVTGIGIGTAMAVNGAAAHAFTHIIYKALLLMSAGSVLLMTGKRKCNELGGLFQSMPITTVCGIVGALAISSFPLTSGFISKSMISQAAVDEHIFSIWLLLAAASAGVFLHAGIKFPWFVFFQKDSGLRPKDPPWNMRLAMGSFAFLCIALGVYPEVLYRLLPYPVAYAPYTTAHVVTQLQLLLFAGLAFFIMLPMLRRTTTITLDIDWSYRVALPWLYERLFTLLGWLQSVTLKFVSIVWSKIKPAAHPLRLWLESFGVNRSVILITLTLVLYLSLALFG